MQDELNPSTIREFIWYFLKLGTTGFGGPIVLCGHMHRDLVDKHRWISNKDYAEGMALSQLMPGPLAAQLAIYIGWVKGRVFGATVVGLAFVLPSFLMVLVLSWLYVNYGGLFWIQGAFYGIGACVIAIIGLSAYKLVMKTFKRDWALWGIGAFSAFFTIWTKSEIIWIFLAAGIGLMLIRAPPKPKVLSGLIPLWLLSGLNGPVESSTRGKLFIFFVKAGAFVFGSGLAVVPFLYGGVVQEHGWLTERQFVDAVAVAMITPGPVVITVAFIGFLVAGFAGAFVSAAGIFFPCYILTIVPAPYFRAISQNYKIRAFVDGVTAAAIGAIGGAAVIIGQKAISDIPTAVIALISLIVLLKVSKIPEPILILFMGLVGVALKTRI